MNVIYRVFKRLMDALLSAILLAALSPLFLLIGLAVRITMGSPVIFKQERPGLKGKPFLLFKFRTMTDGTECGALLPDVKRLTPLGRFLRATSLDELPELLNVLKGEMSFIGPRPLLMRYLPLYSSEQMRRHDVLPGITGWAQVNGRNAIDWERKFQLDVWYVDHCALMIDLWIVLLTVRALIRRDGISQPGCATAEQFKGKGS